MRLAHASGAIGVCGLGVRVGGVDSDPVGAARRFERESDFTRAGGEIQDAGRVDRPFTQNKGNQFEDGGLVGVSVGGAVALVIGGGAERGVGVVD